MNAPASEKVGASGAETVPNPAYQDIINKALEGVDISALEQEEVSDLFGDETTQDDSQESDEETEQASGNETESDNEETPDDDADTAKGKSADKSKGTASEKLPGIDKVLRELDETNPAAAKVVRGLQRDFGDYNTAKKNLDIVQNQTLEMQRQLRAALDEVAGNEEAQDDDQDPNNPLSRVKPEERTLFKQALAAELRRLGVKTQSETDLEEQSKYVTTRVKEHETKFGDSFGKVNDNGHVELSPEIKAKVEAVRDRLASARQGVTWADLHILAMHDEIVKAEAEKAVEEFKKALVAKNGKKVGMLRKASVAVDGSTPSATNTKMRPAKGESPEAFRRRVFDLTWAKLPSLQR